MYQRRDRERRARTRSHRFGQRKEEEVRRRRSPNNRCRGGEDLEDGHPPWQCPAGAGTRPGGKWRLALTRAAGGFYSVCDDWPFSGDSLVGDVGHPRREELGKERRWGEVREKGEGSTLSSLRSKRRESSTRIRPWKGDSCTEKTERGRRSWAQPNSYEMALPAQPNTYEMRPISLQRFLRCLQQSSLQPPSFSALHSRLSDDVFFMRQRGWEFITPIPLLIFPIECKVQRGWGFITLIPLLIFPVECKVQRGWGFITLIPLLIFPIECKIQRGWECVTLIPLLIFLIECKVQRGWGFITLYNPNTLVDLPNWL